MSKRITSVNIWTGQEIGLELQSLIPETWIDGFLLHAYINKAIIAPIFFALLTILPPKFIIFGTLDHHNMEKGDSSKIKPGHAKKIELWSKSAFYNDPDKGPFDFSLADYILVGTVLPVGFH